MTALVFSGAAACSTPSARSPGVPKTTPSAVLASTIRPGPPAVVVDKSRSVAIHVAKDVMDDTARDVANPQEKRVEDQRVRLREAVRDLVRVLGIVAGAKVVVLDESAHADSAYPIFVGALAEAAFGPVGVTAPAEQGFRVVIDEKRAGLYGESPLASSYAIYELLDHLGCRWFFPSELGEVLPKPGSLALPYADAHIAPATIYRSIWYADDAWWRRNRQGGMVLEAGHALEITYVTNGDRAKHPEWRATVGGKPHASRLKWSVPSLALHVADRIIAIHAEDHAPSYSIAPDDGAEFDESPEDRALDAGDFDVQNGTTSLSDRFVWFGNRVAERVAQKHPDVLLGFLAYANYTRAPVREKLHPNLVPQIAPITYSRVHPMSDDRVPGNRDLRALIDGWSKKAPMNAMYFYAWFLAEPVAPNPMITKWGHDVPYVLAHGTKFWMPETFPNFETSMHALYLGMRLAFHPEMRPEDVFDDFEKKLYGAAADAMHTYWRYVDSVWIDTPEYAGSVFGHIRRFTPEKVARMRELMNAAKRAAKTDVEKKRIEMADDSLSLFEEMMTLRHNFIDGRFDKLMAAALAYRAHAKHLANKWERMFAFAKTPWAEDGVYAKYLEGLELPGYADATEIAKKTRIAHLQRKFRWQSDATTKADVAIAARDFDDHAWPETDVAVESWSALGLHDWFKSVWYRATVPSTKPPPGKRAFLWIGNCDGKIRVFVNGKEARYVQRPTGPKTPEGFNAPLGFDVTSLLTAESSMIAVHATRTTLNELGVGGITGPVVLHYEK